MRRAARQPLSQPVAAEKPGVEAPASAGGLSARPPERLRLGGGANYHAHTVHPLSIAVKWGPGARSCLPGGIREPSPLRVSNLYDRPVVNRP